MGCDAGRTSEREPRLSFRIAPCGRARRSHFAAPIQLTERGKHRNIFIQIKINRYRCGFARFLLIRTHVTRRPGQQLPLGRGEQKRPNHPFFDRFSFRGRNLVELTVFVPLLLLAPPVGHFAVDKIVPLLVDDIFQIFFFGFY